MSDFSLPAININELEKELMKHDQVSCPVIHSFGPGIYIRQITIPAGSFAIGHHQNFEHMNIFLKGKVTVLDKNGATETLQAPMMFIGQPGRKIGFIHEEVVWLNVYSTNEKDVEKLEAYLLTKSDSWNEIVENINIQNFLKYESDKIDFDKVIKELGVSKELVKQQSENEDDQIELPNGSYQIKVGMSNIEGKGLFATSNFSAGDLIAPGRIAGKRTIAGRFTNHSPNPNAQMRKGDNGDIFLIALKDITGCKGGLDGEEITINYRDAVKLNLEIGWRN